MVYVYMVYVYGICVYGILSPINMYTMCYYDSMIVTLHYFTFYLIFSKIIKYLTPSIVSCTSLFRQ